MSQPELINTSEFDAHERRQRRIAARYGYRVPSEDDEERNSGARSWQDWQLRI
jgi:hypothetical protein